jgi:hypothetical protein
VARREERELLGRLLAAFAPPPAATSRLRTVRLGLGGDRRLRLRLLGGLGLLGSLGDWLFGRLGLLGSLGLLDGLGYRLFGWLGLFGGLGGGQLSRDIGLWL